MTENTTDRDFVEYVIKQIVSNPEAVKVERKIDEMGVLITLDVDPKDIVYIDDSRDNIRQANKFGMKGIFFTNETMLRAKLIEIAENDN